VEGGTNHNNYGRCGNKNMIINNEKCGAAKLQITNY